MSVLWSAHLDSPAVWEENHILCLSVFILIILKSIYMVIHLCHPYLYPYPHKILVCLVFLQYVWIVWSLQYVSTGVLVCWSQLFHLPFRSAIWGRQLPQPLSPGTPSPTQPSSENQQFQLHHFLLQGSQQQRWPALLPQEDTWWGIKCFIYSNSCRDFEHFCFELLSVNQLNNIIKNENNVTLEITFMHSQASGWSTPSVWCW